MASTAQPLNLGGSELQPSDPAYPSTRVRWYLDMLDTLYSAGGAGSNVWHLADSCPCPGWTLSLLLIALPSPLSCYPGPVYPRWL